MSVRYSISILTYTAVDYARRCIASVLANSPAGEYELLLTANGPIAAAFFDELRDKYPFIRVFKNAKNEGFVAPNIHALAQAEGTWFITLNDDAEVPPNWLEMLRAPFDADPLIAITGPQGAQHGIDVRMGALGRGTQHPEYVEMSCAMMRADIVRSFGLFDPELQWCYWEDVATSLRVRELGYKIMQVPFRIVHHHARTSRHMPETRRYQAENGAVVRRRHAGYLKARRFDYVTIIKRKDAYGDVLLTTPIIRALHERNPRSPIWVETACGEVLKNHPLVAQCGPKLAVPADAWVIPLDRAYEDRPETHIVAAYAEVAGVRDYYCKPEIFVNAIDRAWAVSEMPGDDWIAVHPGPTTWEGKRWPKERFQKVMDWFGGDIVLVGVSAEWAFHGAKDLRGKTTIGQLAAVLARCRLLITIDSLPLHIAQAVGTPIVSLHGVTSPEYIVTDGSPALAVCSDRENPSTGLRHRVKGATMVEDRNSCMDTISVAQVIAAVEQMTVAAGAK